MIERLKNLGAIFVLVFCIALLFMTSTHYLDSSSTTPRLGLTKPTPNVDVNWGASYNANTDIYDTMYTQTGPAPWIDITAPTYGAVGDALFNTSATTSSTGSFPGTPPSNVTTVTTSGNAAFSNSPTIVGKYIAINGGGIGAPTLGTVSQTTGGSLTLLHKYCIQITAIYDNGSLMNSESLPTSESCVTLTGSNNKVTVTAPTLPANATGYRVYLSDAAQTDTPPMVEVQQDSANVCSSTTGRNVDSINNACDASATIAFTTISYAGPTPPSVSTWVTTVATFVSATQVTLQDRIPTDVASAARLAWGTNNDTAWTTARTNCTSTGGANNNGGCIIYFPAVGAYNVPTGRYLTINGFTVNKNNLVMMGGGAIGAASNAGAAFTTNPKPSAEVVVINRNWAIQYGTLTGHFEGGGPVNLGTEDLIGQGYGGLHVTAGDASGSDHFYLRDFNAINFEVGPCIAIDGLQIAEFFNANGQCLYGVRGFDNNSAITFHGGAFNGPQSGAPSSLISYGSWFANNPLSSQARGNIRLFGTQFRDFSTGMHRFSDVPTSEVYALKGENISFTGGGGSGSSYGIAFTVDSPSASSTRCFKDGWWGGHVTRYVNAFSIGANCDSTDIIEPSANAISGTLGTDSGTNSDILLGNTSVGTLANKIAGGLALSENLVASATSPTFDCSKGNTQKIVLAQNATLSAWSNCTKGQTINVLICENHTGGFTWSYGTVPVKGGSVTSTSADVCNSQEFLFDDKSEFKALDATIVVSCTASAC